MRKPHLKIDDWAMTKDGSKVLRVDWIVDIDGVRMIGSHGMSEKIPSTDLVKLTCSPKDMMYRLRVATRTINKLRRKLFEYEQYKLRRKKFE